MSGKKNDNATCGVVFARFSLSWSMQKLIGLCMERSVACESYSFAMVRIPYGGARFAMNGNRTMSTMRTETVVANKFRSGKHQTAGPIAKLAELAHGCLRMGFRSAGRRKLV